jgi:hypothetical protein
MKTLLEKLNYKGQERIAVINSGKNFRLAPDNELNNIRIDNEIDQRVPYGFMIIFVRELSEIEKFTPLALHNLTDDGTLWYCYPKKTSRKFSQDIDRDHGWKALNDMDFYGIRMVSVDDTWSAMRFRNRKYIKSRSGRFTFKKDQR